MIYLLLISEFFKIGLFSFGGGFATIPFLFHISQEYNWYNIEELSHMTAIASITPGPIGINIATFAGLKTAGFLGALIATISEMLPSLFLIIVISKVLKKFKDNFYIKSVIATLKPIGCALLASVAIEMLYNQLNNIQALILLSILLILSWKSKKDPIFYISISAIAGILIHIL